MSFPGYPKYKKSGVKFLKEVPEHWRVGAIKYFVLPKNGAIKTGPFGSHLTSADMQGGSIKVYNQRSVIDGDFDSGDNFISEEKFAELASFEIFPGDLLVTTRGTIGRVAILPEKSERGILHPCLLRLQPDNSLVDTRFLKTLIQDSDLMKTQLNYLSNATTIEVIYSYTIASVIIPVPRIDEQRLILNFLDHETAKLDDLVAEQQRLIQLLKEKRQAVISHAVTKGLNPDAPMKPSGIEWLGDVPEHWEVMPMKHFARTKTGFAFSSDLFIDDGVPVLRIGDITTVGTVDFSSARFLPGNYIETHTDVLVQRDDLVMAMTGATIGKAARYISDEPALLNQRVCVFRTDDCDSQSFLWYFLQTSFYAEYLTITAFGGAQPNISDRELVAVAMPIPSKTEFTQIVNLLDHENKKLNELTAEAQRAIDLLQERRTALISAAVTGKIDVRGLVSTEAS